MQPDIHIFEKQEQTHAKNTIQYVVVDQPMAGYPK